MRTQGSIRKDQQGFTLIELMVTVIIVAVLMAIALPTYRNQVLRGHRAAAKAEMLEIANRQEQYLLANRSYTNDLGKISYALPTDVSPNYIPSLSTTSASGVPYFKISFKPQGNQLDDGSADLTLDSLGARTPAAKWER